MQQKTLNWRVINEVGNKYGMLTVISASDLRSKNDGRFQRWVCKCDCGQEVIIRGSSLRQGNTTNCGCESRRKIGVRQAVEITGRKFGMLTAIRSTWESNKRGYVWECICDCGKKCFYPAKDLTSHNVISCGCIKSPKSEQFIIEKLYSRYKKSAKKRKIEFDLPIFDFTSLIKSDCFYCGASPKRRYNHNKPSLLAHGGVDRVDNNVGYVVFNCVPCCGNCNRMKFKSSKECFLEHIRRIYFFQISKNKS